MPHRYQLAARLDPAPFDIWLRVRNGLKGTLGGIASDGLELSKHLRRQDKQTIRNSACSDSQGPSARAKSDPTLTRYLVPRLCALCSGQREQLVRQSAVWSFQTHTTRTRLSHIQSSRCCYLMTAHYVHLELDKNTSGRATFGGRGRIPVGVTLCKWPRTPCST